MPGTTSGVAASLVLCLVDVRVPGRLPATLEFQNGEIQDSAPFQGWGYTTSWEEAPHCT